MEEKSICFIDFKKAFDVVEHEAIWAVLKSYDVGNKLISVLESSYNISEAAVRCSLEKGMWFPANLGIRQGDSLSSLLFIAYLDRVMDLRKGND